MFLADTAALTAERDEYLGALQRLQADFENYRKRVLRQQEEQSARAAADLIEKLLPVLDTLDLAEAHAAKEEGEAAAKDGIAQVRTMLIGVLGREGLERVDESGVAFDPLVHDAVAHAEALDPDEGEPVGPEDDEQSASGGSGEVMVDEVLRSGYRWRGQVLRPAMVRVRG
jgi:molecular chaperone GrpE